MFSVRFRGKNPEEIRELVRRAKAVGIEIDLERSSLRESRAGGEPFWDTYGKGMLTDWSTPPADPAPRGGTVQTVVAQGRALPPGGRPRRRS